MRRPGDERTYTYDKAKILDLMKQKRSSHRALFEEALDGYFNQAQKITDELRADLLSRRKADFYRLVRLTVPEDHTTDYDAVIEMLELSQGSTVELTEQEFRSYVRDEWDWKEQFTASVAAYTS